MRWLAILFHLSNLRAVPHTIAQRARARHDVDHTARTSCDRRGLGVTTSHQRESTARHAPVLPAARRNALSGTARRRLPGASNVKYLRHAGPHERLDDVAAHDPDRIEPLSARPAVRDLQREHEVNTPTRGRDPGRCGSIPVTGGVGVGGVLLQM